MVVNDDFTKLITRLDTAIRRLKNMPDTIETEIILCSSKEELFRKRCELTDNPSALSNPLHNKDKYSNVAGCYIIPPKEKYQFTILLLRSTSDFYDAYNFAHELVHISNYFEYLNASSCTNPFEPLEKQKFTLWDEYNARYVSTIAMIEIFEPEVNKKDLCHCIKVIGDVLRKCVTEDNIESYDGSQLLGFVEAAFEKNIIPNYNDYLSFKEISVLDNYKNVAGINYFI